MPRMRGHWQNQGEPMTEYTNSQMERLISEIIHSERDRNILHDRLIDGMTFEQIAEKHDLSVQRIKSIVYKQRERLFRGL